MFSTLPRLAAPLAKRAFATRAFVAVRPQISSVVASPFAVQWQAQRAYSAAAGLSADSIKERIMEVLTSFEKVDPSKVTVTSSFTNDLGLDSLDAVEVVMAIEEEFSIEIPDEEADRITTVAEAIDYISKSAEAH